MNYKVMELRNNAPEAQALAEAARASRHRSVYLPLVRTLVPASLAPFDFAEQGMVTGSRDATTVAPQALYLLNDPFVREQALAFAKRLAADRKPADGGRVEQAYRLAFGRPAATAEVARALEYVADYRREFSRLADAGLAGPPRGAKTAAEEDPRTAQVPAPPKKSSPQPAESAIPENPDDVDRTDSSVVTERVNFEDAETAAWTSFCQALFATAEFRYVP
jgi:hypothetical protein